MPKARKRPSAASSQRSSSNVEKAKEAKIAETKDSEVQKLEQDSEVQKLEKATEVKDKTEAHKEPTEKTDADKEPEKKDNETDLEPASSQETLVFGEEEEWLEKNRQTERFSELP